MKKNTDDLQQELMETADLSRFLQENRESFHSEQLIQRLTQLTKEKGISKTALAERASISEVYLHQIFAGRRSPSRNRVLCLCFGLQTSVEEVQELLRLGSMARLDPRNVRDAVIIHALGHGMTLTEANRNLFEQNMETLF